jgi:hypothetical protein
LCAWYEVVFAETSDQRTNLLGGRATKARALPAQYSRLGEQSLNHLIRAQQRLRNNEAEGSGSLLIDDRTELGRLLDWKVRGIRSFQDLVDVLGGEIEKLPFIGSVSQQPA